MTAQRYILWFSILIFAVMLASLQWLGTISTSFLIGFLMAYLCLPLVNYFEARGLGRSLSAAISMFIAILFIALVLILPVPLVKDQIIWLSEHMSLIIESSNRVLSWIQTLLPFERIQESNQFEQLLFAHWKDAGNLAKFISTWVLTSGDWVIGIITAMILVPLVMFYFLRDWRSIFSLLYRLLPQRVAPLVAEYVQEAHYALSTFLHGQILVISMLAILYSAGLWLVGLKLAMVVGIFAGIFSLIPYVGMIAGSLLAIIAWFLQGGDWILLISIAVVFIAVQLIEMIWLTPRLIGNRLGLHPLAVLFALIIGGNLFGIGGMLFSLPLLAVIIAVARHTVKKMESEV